MGNFNFQILHNKLNIKTAFKSSLYSVYQLNIGLIFYAPNFTKKFNQKILNI